MRSRCNNPNNRAYKRYGGRGIKVCKEWNNYWVFYDWANENGYEENLTIDRIDNDGNYCPQNCRWITLSEQQQTRSSCHMITHNGKTQNITLWAKEYGIARKTIRNRLEKGLPVDQVLKGVM